MLLQHNLSGLSYLMIYTILKLTVERKSSAQILLAATKIACRLFCVSTVCGNCLRAVRCQWYCRFCAFMNYWVQTQRVQYEIICRIPYCRVSTLTLYWQKYAMVQAPISLFGHWLLLSSLCKKKRRFWERKQRLMFLTENG